MKHHNLTSAWLPMVLALVMAAPLSANAGEGHDHGAALARDEETAFSAPDRARPVMPWVIAMAVAVVVAVGGILTALLATGVL